MARRSKSPFELMLDRLSRLPWPAGLALAAGVFLGLRRFMMQAPMPMGPGEFSAGMLMSEFIKRARRRPPDRRTAGLSRL